MDVRTTRHRHARHPRGHAAGAPPQPRPHKRTVEGVHGIKPHGNAEQTKTERAIIDERQRRLDQTGAGGHMKPTAKQCEGAHKEARTSERQKHGN